MYRQHDGKLANAITDTAVTMACKAQLRNQKPIVWQLRQMTVLGLNGKNIGLLLSTMFIRTVHQDDPVGKPNSLVTDFDLIEPTIEHALRKQIQPVLL